MKRVESVWPLVIAVLLAAAGPAAAQAPLSLSLDDAAAARRGRMRRGWPRRARASAPPKPACSHARPPVRRPLSTSAGYQRTNHVDEFGVPQPDGGFHVLFPDMPNNYFARAEVALPIDSSGRIRQSVSAAEADARASAADMAGGGARMCGSTSCGRTGRS